MKTPERRESDIESDKLKYIESLQRLLTDYSDEIPEEMVLTGPYKVRGNWFSGVISYIRLILRKGYIRDESLIRDFKEFSDDFIKRKRAIPDFRTTQEDIEQANSLLRRVIGYLLNI